MPQRDIHKPESCNCHLIRVCVKSAGIIIALCFLAGTLAQAQDSLSGLPLDNFQFKESHYANNHDEEIDDQMDNYNVWGLELDLQFGYDCGPCISVDHSCLPNDGDQRLSESIAEILRSTDMSNRITFIWLDIKDSGWGPWNYCYNEWPYNRREFIRNGMLGLGVDNIYTKTEFDLDFATNGGHWPSWQNLRDRGKKFIIVLEDPIERPPSGKDDDPVLFIAVSSISEAKSVPHATFINIEHADTAFGVPQPNDRYIYRAWNTDWNDAAARGFNLIQTDDIDQGYTITDSRTHSPQPMYVNGFAFNEDRLWGTKNYPMNLIASALVRATPGTTLRIHPGSYAGPYTLDKPMIVEKDPRYVGLVVIGRE